MGAAPSSSARCPLRTAEQRRRTRMILGTAALAVGVRYLLGIGRDVRAFFGTVLAVIGILLM